MIRVVDRAGLAFVGFSIDLYDDDGQDLTMLHLGLEATDEEIARYLDREAPARGATRAEVFEIRSGIHLVGRWERGTWTQVLERCP